MSLKRTMLGVMGALVVGAAAGTMVLAAPASAAPQAAATPPSATIAHASPHASLRLDVGHGKAWVGQALPVTVTAYFRNVEGVTLEGTPQLSSTGLFTSDVAREPRQATEIINGEPVLVATWTGTITPATAASLDLAAQLPVRVRYRDAAPRVELQDPFGEDPFDALAANPFDTSIFNRFFNQAMRPESLGRTHEEDVSLRATARPIDVQALPTKDQPSSFTGAIGRFDLVTSLSSTRALVSEPLTLRVVVEGQGDLDRVDLPGVATSSDWKAYPPKSSLEPATKGRRARKVFEQVLIPLRGGNLSVPPVSLTAFDPSLGRYVTQDTPPLPVSVDGTAVAEAPRADAPAVPTTPPPGQAAAPGNTTPPAAPRRVRMTTAGLWFAPMLLPIAGAWILAARRRRKAERSLRRTMRTAASRGDALPFYSAAHSLIEHRLAKRWRVSPAEVNPELIREHLGPDGDALADVLVADEALRFGRAKLEQPDLVTVCSSIEQSLGSAS